MRHFPLNSIVKAVQNIINFQLVCMNYDDSLYTDTLRNYLPKTIKNPFRFTLLVVQQPSTLFCPPNLA